MAFIVMPYDQSSLPDDESTLRSRSTAFRVPGKYKSSDKLTTLRRLDDWYKIGKKTTICV